MVPCNDVTISGGIYTAAFGGDLTSIFKVGDTLSISRSNHVASGLASHAEGASTMATGHASHAEGSFTIASDYCSHAEGDSTIASNYHSHAEGLGTIAAGGQQHAQGKYNIQDLTLAHIVGNGTADDARSNAHTLDFNGNAWYAGDVYVGSTSRTNKDAGSKKLASEEYVINNSGVKKISQDTFIADLDNGIYMATNKIKIYASNDTYMFISSGALLFVRSGNNSKNFMFISNDSTAPTRTYMGFGYAGNNKTSGLFSNELSSKYSYQPANDRVSSISSSSTNTQYPSAKAVYDFVTDQIATSITQAIGGSY